MSTKQTVSAAVKTESKRRLTKRTLIAMLLILIVIPLTIYLGLLLGDRKYYFISLLI